jgi:hypothetical protein
MRSESKATLVIKRKNGKKKKFYMCFECAKEEFFPCLSGEMKNND